MIFTVHFDDLKKLLMVESIFDKIMKGNLFQQFKHLKFVKMLIESMHYLSLNDEVVAGQLIVYIGDLIYNYEKNNIYNSPI